MITVMAGSGQFGRLVVDRLLERVPAGEVAVAVRDTGRAADLAARGVAVRHGDFDDPVSLRSAFAGTDVLLFISGPSEEPGARVPSTATSSTRRSPRASARSSTRAGWVRTSSRTGCWASTTPPSRRFATAGCRTPSCGTPSTRTSSSTRACGRRSRPASSPAASAPGA
ncbi:NAD(P)H-binding protein [Georgenia sp. EYE_87]|nr:NAD(P)H-binding protein [Georgenia sp. EYE_87]